MMCLKTEKMFFVIRAFILYHFITSVQSSETVTELEMLNNTVTELEMLNNTGTELEMLTNTGTEPTAITDKTNTTSGLSECLSYVLEEGEFTMFENGTLYIEVYNITLNESMYIRNKESVIICAPAMEDGNVHKDFVAKSSDLSLIGLGISMICLLMHLVVFSIVADLRNLPGWNLAALCASLFISYLMLFLIISGVATDNKNMCIASASLAHFFLLASFFWMSVMSFDVFMSLVRATGSLKVSSAHFKLKKFGIYCLFSFGVALFFAVFGLLADLLDIVPQLYKPEFEELCWFSKRTPLLVFFAGPVIALTCLNFIFFGLSSYVIHTNKMVSNTDDHHASLRRNYLMYFRLSVIMGVTWIVGVIAPIANVDWMWYIFVFLNTLQGLYIFLAFTCSSKVKKYFREKLSGPRRASSTQTLAPTFQSYCFYANSIEKDLNKIVDTKDGKTETIVIHL